MEYMFSAAHADPWILWMSRALFLIVAGYIATAIYLEWHHIRAALIAFVGIARDLGAQAWAQWGPLLRSRAIIGGLIMFGDYQFRAHLPPEALNAFTEIGLAFIATFGAALVAIGRVYASGPLKMHSPGLMPPGAAAELSNSRLMLDDDWHELIGRPHAIGIEEFRTAPIPSRPATKPKRRARSKVAKSKRRA